MRVSVWRPRFSRRRRLLRRPSEACALAHRPLMKVRSRCYSCCGFRPSRIFDCLFLWDFFSRGHGASSASGGDDDEEEEDEEEGKPSNEGAEGAGESGGAVAEGDVGNIARRQARQAPSTSGRRRALGRRPAHTGRRTAAGHDVTLGRNAAPVSSPTEAE